VTKTDLAKFVNAWDQKPHVVGLGSQKNFERFMEGFREQEGQLPSPLPDLASYKAMIAKAILFKKAHALVRPMFPAFQANVTAYLVAVTANLLGDRFELERVWLRQDISSGLRQQLQTWAVEVNSVLHRSAEGRMVSEWAKKMECWEAVRTSTYSDHISGISELR
jgi:hypothetical protein